MSPLRKDIKLIAYFRSRFWIWLFNKMPNHGSFDGLRCKLLKLSGFKIENTVKVFSPIHISPKTKPGNIHLKGFLFVNSGARFSAPTDTRITLNKSCLIGPGVSFETVNHGLKYDSEKSRGATLGNITLEEGVWVGANAIILQNVSVGKGAVVAASAVVAKSVQANTVVGGIPAKFIKNTHENN